MSVVVKIDNIEVVGKLQNPEFGIFVAREWKRLIDPYTPRQLGNLQESAVVEPFMITYGMAGTPEYDYASYMYNGIIYVDPEQRQNNWKFNLGGFGTGGAGTLGIPYVRSTWVSRRGVTKIPRTHATKTRPINFRYEKINPFATDHWDEKAEAAGQVDKLVQIINSALNSGRFK